MHDDSSPLKMGPVIGGMGDVNVTNVVNTEKDAECAKCGTHCTKGQFSTCQGCRKTFCNLHFNRDLGLCLFCESGKEKDAEAEFLCFLKKIVSDDNKMSGPELIKLKKEGIRLGLEASEIDRIREEFLNKGLKGTTQDLIESARKLYEMGQIAEASERLAKFSDEELLEREQPDLLDLYLRIQAVMNPNKLIRFIEEWPVETEERFVAEFCVREDRVAARSVLYKLRDRKQEDFFSAERIQICWLLSEIEEALALGKADLLDELSKNICERLKTLPTEYEPVFNDLSVILDSQSELNQAPTHLFKDITLLTDAITLRATTICQKVWNKFPRALRKGSFYRGRISGIKEWGVFIEVFPGQEGLLHILEFASPPSQPLENFLKVGDSMEVKCLSIDERGRIKLSQKAALQDIISKEISSLDDLNATTLPHSVDGHWDELKRASSTFLTEEIHKIVVCMFNALGAEKQIFLNTILGKAFFDDWGEDFSRFMSSEQFELVRVKNLCGKPWGMSFESWDGWVIAPFLKASNQTCLDGEPLLIPQPLTKPATLSLGKTGKCCFRIECRTR
jgi:hypothetical protein